MPTKTIDTRNDAFRRAVGGAITQKHRKKTEVAQKLNRTRGTLRNWLDHPEHVPLGDLRRLVRELGIEDDEILRMVR